MKKMGIAIILCVRLTFGYLALAVRTFVFDEARILTKQQYYLDSPE